MTDLRKAAEMALEALEAHSVGKDHPEPITKTIQALRQALSNEFNPDWNQVEALQESLREHMDEIQRLRQALAQPEQKPVGQLQEDAYGRGQVLWFNKPPDQTMLYIAPPKREWVGLTGNEAKDFYEKYTNREELIYAIDEFLEEKNA